MDYPLNPKDIQFRRITESTVIHDGPCLFVEVVLTCESTQRYLTIYDGNSASGDPFVDLRGPSKASFCFCPAIPQYMAKGIYADIEGSIKGATIRFVPLQQGE